MESEQGSTPAPPNSEAAAEELRAYKARKRTMVVFVRPSGPPLCDPGMPPFQAGGPLSQAADRLRESLFNILQHAYGDPVTGARVLDLFAGSGARG